MLTCLADLLATELFEHRRGGWFGRRYSFRLQQPYDRDAIDVQDENRRLTVVSFDPRDVATPDQAFSLVDATQHYVDLLEAFDGHRQVVWS